MAALTENPQYPMIERLDYDPVQSFSPGSLGVQNNLLISSSGVPIQHTTVVWGVGHHAASSMEPIISITQAKDFILDVNTTISGLTRPVLSAELQDNFTVREQIESACDVRALCHLMTLLDSIFLGLDDKQVFTPDDYRVAALIQISNFTKNMEEGRFQEMCNDILEMATATHQFYLHDLDAIKRKMQALKANQAKHAKNSEKKIEAKSWYLADKIELDKLPKQELYRRLVAKFSLTPSMSRKLIEDINR